jgi:hypothetical protein
MTIDTDRMVSFSSSTERRVVLAMGDFIRYGANSTIARIDQVFVHELSRKRRIFMKVTDVDTAITGRKDELLDVPILRILPPFGTAIRFVGLPAIHAEKLYIVPVKKPRVQAGGRRSGLELGDSKSPGDLLHVPWTVQYL